MIELGTLEITVGEEEVKLDLDSLLNVGDDISAEFKNQPALYAYIAILAAQAEGGWLDAKRQLDKIKAHADGQVRKQLLHSGDKITETIVANMVTLDESVEDVSTVELNAKMQYSIMKALVTAFAQRAEMLVSLGAQYRAERDQIDMKISQVKGQLRTKLTSTPSSPVNTDEETIAF